MVLAAGLLQIPVIKKAREMGVYVIAVDDDLNAPGMALADKAVVPGGLVNEEKLLAIAKEEQIDGVIHPCSEVAMNVMGRINDELHLHGISRETAVRATNKHLMREAFEKYGAPSPKSYCTDNAEEGFRLYNQIRGNAILKPSRNSGSRGIAEIEPGMTFSDFEPLFERSKKESRDASVMIEQFVEGPEFSVEIIVWNKEVHVLQVTDKKTTEAPYFVELGHSQPSQFPVEIVEKIKDAAVKGVKALQLDNCAVHAEVKVQDGVPYLMEIGARLGGDFISTELTHLSTGIDMVAAAIDVALGNEPNLQPIAEPQGVAIRYFTPEPGEVEIVKEEELQCAEHVYDAELYVKPGDMVKEVQSSLDRSGHVIVTDKTVQLAVKEAETLVGRGMLYQNPSADTQRQKRLLILGGGFLQNFVIKKARELGYYVYVLDPALNSVGFQYAHEHALINIIDEEACLAYALYKKVDGVLTAATDFAVLAMSRIANEMNLPGIDYTVARIIKNKAAVRKCLYEAHADDTGYAFEINDIEQVDIILSQIQFPVMVKPCDGSGSRGASKVERKEDFKKACEYAISGSVTHRAIAEPFVIGKEYGVESFVDHGEIHVLAVMQKDMTLPPYYAELGHAIPSGLDPKLENRVKACVIKAIKALGVNHGSVNMDLLITDNGEVHIVDIGARMGGNLIGSHIIPIGTGIDYMGNMIRAAVGDKTNWEPVSKAEPVATKLLALTPGVVVKLPDMETIARELDVTIEHHLHVGDTINEYHTNLDGCGYVVCKRQTTGEAIRDAKRTKETIDQLIERA